MYRLINNFDIAEGKPQEVSRKLVVVARYIRHTGALARFAQNFLHHVVVQAMPVPASRKLPAVNDVSDKIELLGLSVL